MRLDPCCPCNNFTNFCEKHLWFGLCCIFQYFQQTVIRFKSYSPLKYFVQVSTKSSILFNFHQNCFSLFICPILNKFQSKTIQVDLYILSFFKKMINFCQKHIWFKLCCIFQHIQKLQIKISYNINHIVLSKTLYKFRSKASFSVLNIS